MAIALRSVTIALRSVIYELRSMMFSLRGITYVLRNVTLVLRAMTILLRDVMFSFSCMFLYSPIKTPIKYFFVHLLTSTPSQYKMQIQRNQL
jgi:hypothetical protein